MRQLTAALSAAATAVVLLGLPAAGADVATDDCVPPLARVDAASPIGFGSCPGVRPGALVLIPRPDLGRGEQVACTLNFFFRGRDPAGGTHAYMGTAGHCIFASGEPSDFAEIRRERVWPLGGGPPVFDARGRRIGEFAYAALDARRDFALVRIFGGVAVSPEICHFGGPTGTNLDTSARLTYLHHYGQGIGVSAATPARTSVVYGMPDPDWVRATGIVVPGDSGGPVISSDGRAVGVVVSIGVHSRQIGTSGVDAGTVGITRLRPQLNRAAQRLNQYLYLQTAPLR